MKLTRNVRVLLASGLIGVSALANATSVGSGANAGGDARVIEEKAYLAGSLKAKYPTTNFSEINPTPIAGIYELVTGKNIFYTDKEGAYLIFGSMYDMSKSRDLTAERKEQLNKLDFASLDPKNAIVEVKGDGARKLAILTDVDCPFCKKLEETLTNVTNVTIYRYLYPIDSLHPSARATSEAIWCLNDNQQRLTAMMNYMVRGMAPAGQRGCDTPLAEVQAFAKKHELFGTPSMVNGAGQILPGAVPQERLEAFLNAGMGNDGDAVVVTNAPGSN